MRIVELRSSCGRCCLTSLTSRLRAISEVEAVCIQLLAVLQGIQVMSTIVSKGASVGNNKPLFQHCHESFELAQALPSDTLVYQRKETA
ncbi:hypothetical protein GGI09_000955 [Coemansia sp. S100]|nr:hypothetical protein GGI09_000955 [Coemansia sp. S100]KAJ2106052.1 hypothetical protein GGI16_002085 [Coemansia sp. S142-1]